MSRTSRGWRMAGKSTWQKFRDENPEIKLSYVEYQNIIYGFNENFRDYLLETGVKAKLPWGFGDFVIAKKKPKKFRKSRMTGENLVNLPVDWQKTKELGFRVYHFNSHTEGFKFYLKWFSYKARFAFSEVWSFKPSRITSRLISHHIQKNPDSQFKYQEWESIRYK